MQVFRSRFSTDASGHIRAMSEFRDQSCSAINSVQRRLLALGGMVISFAGIKAAVSDCLALGAAMENTRISFATMMGSVEKGNAVLAQLRKFSDVTPFDDQEVIKSGLMMLNVGTAVGKLNGKLEILGNIASGTSAAGNTLAGMVAIYAKAANKGKVQTEELLQLSERGVPVIKAFANMLGVAEAEVLDLGSKGKLSFRLLEEALATLGGAGGQYFELMEKQSQSLKGKFDGLMIALRNIRTEIGEKAQEGLKRSLDDLLAFIEKLRESGDLDRMIRSTSKAISDAGRAVVRLVEYISTHREELKHLGFTLAGVAVLNKTISAVTAAQGSLAGLSAEAAKSNSKVSLLAATLLKLKGAAGVAGTALATAFAGYELGKYLGKVLKLEDGMPVPGTGK
nr:tape measure protein [Victivallaceae bacterium]